jgi:hypothetical protein
VEEVEDLMQEEEEEQEDIEHLFQGELKFH